jgi:hypothetical protein
VQHCLCFYSTEGFLKGGLRHAVVRAILRHSNSPSCRCVIVPLSILLFSVLSSVSCLFLVLFMSSFIRACL